MSIRRENYIYILMAIPAFLFGGFLHVALYGVDFCDCICQIYYAALVLAWGTTIKKRIVDRRIRIRLMVAAAMMVMLFIMQMCKFKLFVDDLNALRYVWYGYYVFILLVPCQLYQISILVGTEEKQRIKKRLTIPVLAITCLFVVMVLTNDWHQMIFSFPNGIINGVYDNDNEIMFVAMYAWVAVMHILALIIVTKKSRVFAVKRAVWIPIVVFLTGCVGIVLASASVIEFHNINIWMLCEMYFFAEIGFVESCICVGLIPTSVGYKRLLGFTKKMITIADAEGEIVYKSDIDSKAVAEDENWLMFTDEISGGTISWAVDMSAVFNLNRQIEKVTEQIAIRNEYLHTQNDLVAEKLKINARNELYDNMAEILRPQIQKIEELLNSGQESDFDGNLREIAVLNAYIKRRSNMELLRADGDVLQLKELYLALSESCEYIKLCDVETYAAPVGDETVPGGMAALIYDFFERFVERNLKLLKTLMVLVKFSDNGLDLRLMTNIKEAGIDDNWYKSFGEWTPKISVTHEEQDSVITLSLETGVNGHD